MSIEIFLSILSLAIFGIYFFRGAVNWILLNKIEGTNHPIIFKAKPTDLILTFRHLTISAIKIWWHGEEYKKLKSFSNFLSFLLYLAVLLLIAVIASKI